MYYIGIDLGGTNIAAGITDENGNIICKDSVPTGREREYGDIIKDMAMLSLALVKKSQIAMEDIKGIGIGAPGTPDTRNGILLYANNLKFKNVPMRTEMQKYIDLPVFIENDANCAALAESVAGAASDVENSITITLGTGIGGGIVIGRKVYSGFNGAAAEVGHISIVMDGKQCTCGRKGCWEAYGSAEALIEQAREAAKENPCSLVNELVDGDLSKVNAKIPFDAARHGDETAKKVVDRYIRYVAEGLTNLINVFTPQVVVIGGGISKEGEYLLKPLREHIYRDVYAKDVPQTELRIAKLGNDAGIVGAAMLGANTTGS
ncbi:MAG: ROK family glucokinase [Clostridiaceae bacterium]|nr:ROK family glucokinase [Clostridiaceae bacterium]